jgi:hypothetical protein
MFRDANAIRLLAFHGVPMDGDFYDGDSTPIDEAVYYKHREVAVALFEVGAEKVIDPEKVQQVHRDQGRAWGGPHFRRGKVAWPG